MRFLALAAAASVAATDTSGASGEALAKLLRGSRPTAVLRTDYYQSSKRFDSETGFLGATAQLKLLPTLGSRVDGKLEARATNFSIADGGSTRTTLLEGYFSIHFDKSDLRVGKQIVAWGRADGLNPTDNLTPRDFVALLPFEDDQRFGTTAVRLDTALSQEHTVTLFVSPFFEPSKFPLPAEGRSYRDKTPAHSVSNSEVGLRLNKVGVGLDWSVSYFRGFSLLPDPHLIGNNTFELRYDRINVFGTDLARNYGRFGFRGEMAYVDPAIKNPYLYWIAGIDRTFFSNLNLNLQFFQRDAIGNGITFRISNQWLNDTLEAEVFAVTNLTSANSFVRPLLTYAFTDHWKATIGGEIYRGAGDTQYGSLKSNRGMFAELRYGF
jgi:hypothetical protein